MKSDSEHFVLKSKIEYIFDKMFGLKRRPLKVSHGLYISKMWKLEWFSAWLYHYVNGNKREKYNLLIQLLKKNSKHYPPPNFHPPYRKIRNSLTRRVLLELNKFNRQRYYKKRNEEIRRWLRRTGLNKKFRAAEKAGLKYQH